MKAIKVSNVRKSNLCPVNKPSRKGLLNLNESLEDDFIVFVFPSISFLQSIVWITWNEKT